MPDIQKCTGIYYDKATGTAVECGMKAECYRCTSVSSMVQAWGPPGANFKANKGCENIIIAFPPIVPK